MTFEHLDEWYETIMESEVMQGDEIADAMKMNWMKMLSYGYNQLERK